MIRILRVFYSSRYLNGKEDSNNISEFPSGKDDGDDVTLDTTDIGVGIGTQNVAGHPLVLMDILCMRICTMLSGNNSDSVHDAGLFRKDLIRIEHLYGSSGNVTWTYSNPPPIDATFVERYGSSQRAHVVECMEVLPILLQWPKNMANIRISHGKAFYDYFVICYGLFASKLVELSVRRHQALSSGAQQTPEYNQQYLQDVHFTLRILLTLTRIFSHSLLWDSYEFYDYLPTQPWSIDETESLLVDEECIARASSSTTSQLHSPIKCGALRSEKISRFPCNIASTSNSKVSPAVYSTTINSSAASNAPEVDADGNQSPVKPRVERKCDVNQLRKDNVLDWKSSGCLEALMSLWNVLPDVRSSTPDLTIALDDDEDCFARLKYLKNKQEVLILLIEAEILNTLSNLFFISPEVVASYFDEDFSVNKLLAGTLVESSLQNEVVDALRIRMHLLCLRINYSLMQQRQVSGQLEPERRFEAVDDDLDGLRLLASYNTATFRGILSPVEVAKVLIWYQSKYQSDWINLERYHDATPVASTSKGSKSPMSYILSFNYQKSVGQVNTSHDLWPWESIQSSTVKMTTESGSSLNHDFHILHPELIQDLKLTAKKQNVYMLWDAVFGELMRSQALSTTREPPPVPDLTAPTTRSSRVASQHYQYLQQQDHDCKLTKPILRYIFQVFQQLFMIVNNESAAQPDDLSPESSELNLTESALATSPTGLPKTKRVCYVALLGQMKFIDFITELFKAADASDIFSVFDEFEVVQLFLDDAFLSSYRSSSCLAKLTAKLKDLIDESPCQDDSIPNVLTKRLTIDQIMIHASNGAGCSGVIGWLLLQTVVMDLFLSLSVYSIYFADANDTITSYLSYEDIMLLLTEKMLEGITSLSTSEVIDVEYDDIDPQQTEIATQQQSSASICIYQLAKLMAALQEIVLTTGSSTSTVGKKIEIRNQVIRNLLEIVEMLSCHSIIDRRVLPADAELADVAENDRRSRETWVLDAASAASAEALIYLITTTAEVAPKDWLDIFLNNDRFRAVDLPSEFQLLGINRSQQYQQLMAQMHSQQRKEELQKLQQSQYQVVQSSTRWSAWNARYSDLRMSVGSIDMQNEGSGRKEPGSNRERDRKLHSSVASLLIILLNERFYSASLQIMKAMLLACAEEVYTIDKAALSSSLSSENKESSRQRKQVLRNLVTEVIVSLLMLVSASYRLSPQRCSINQVLSSLNMVIHLLRYEQYSGLRLTFQEFIRRGNVFKEILRAFAKCLNGYDLVKQKFGMVEGIPVIEKDSSRMMRACLSLLTAAVCGNESCKHDLSVLLHANRERVGSARMKTSADNRGTELHVASDVATQEDIIAAKTATGLTSLILCGESFPTKETIIVILDLILDGPFAGFEYLMKNGGTISMSGEEFASGKTGSERLVEKLFVVDVDRPKIHNFAVLPDYFHLIPHCSDSVQHFALESFKNLISGRASLVNLNVCSNSLPKVLDIALDLFPYLSDAMQSINAEIVERLGRHSISVATLKHLFRTLQQQEGFKHTYAWKVVKSLQGMFLHDPGPNHTFVFDGNGSGLKLPIVYKWPQTMKGFAFCCWIKVESPRQRDDQRKMNESDMNSVNIDTTSVSSGTAASTIPAEEQEYHPYIFCMTDDGGAGLEFTLKKISGKTGRQSFRLSLSFKSDTPIPANSSNLNRKRSNTQITAVGEGEQPSDIDFFSFIPDGDNFVIREDKWYFVGLSLTPISYYSKGEAIIVLNHQVAKQEFHYTKLPDNVLPLIGDCCPKYTAADSQNFPHSLRGQMGAMYFFSDALDEIQLRSICCLGPDYLYNFEPSSADYKDRTTMSPASATTTSVTTAQQRVMVDNWWKILEDGILTTKILLTYNPIALRGSYFLDNTPSGNDIKWKLPHNVDIEEELRRGDSTSGSSSSRYCKMHALRLTGTYRSSIQAVQFALNSLGGIRAIIPLFGQVDQGLTAESISSGVPPSPASSTSTSIQHQQELNFFPAVLGLFTTILEASIEYKRSFHRCGGFYTVRYLLDKVNPVNFNKITLYQFIELFSKLSNEMILQDALLETVLCDFKLWANSAPDVQCHLIDWLIRHFQNRTYCKNMFPQALGVQRLIDIMYQFYDYDVAAVSLLLQQNNRRRASSSMSSMGSSASSNTLLNSVSASTITELAIVPINSVASSSNTSTLPKRVRLSTVDHEGLALIRAKIFEMVKVSLLNRTTSEDMVTIIKYLSLVTTDCCRQEVLIFLIDILTSNEFKDRSLQLLLGVLKENCIELLEHVLLIGCDEVKMLVFSLYAVLLYQMNKNWTALASLYIKYAPTKKPRVNSSDGLSPESLKRRHQVEVTSPSNFMQGSGLMHCTVQLLSSCVIAFGSSAVFEGSFISAAFLDMLMGRYPQPLLDFVKQHVGIQDKETDLATALEKKVELSGRTTPEPPGPTAFSFPFVFFVLLKFSCSDSWKHTESFRVQQLTNLVGLLSPFVAEQLLGVWGWQEIVISSLKMLWKAQGGKIITRSVGLVIEILSQLVAYSIKLGNVVDYNYVLSPEMKNISLEIQCEIYGRITCGERQVGMTAVRDLMTVILQEHDDSVSFSFQAFMVFNILAHCVSTTKTLLRQYHSAASKVHDPQEFLFVQRRSIWLIGVVLKEFMTLIEQHQPVAHEQISDTIPNDLEEGQEYWVKMHKVFENALSPNKTDSLAPLVGQLIKGYLEFSADIKIDNAQVPICETTPVYLAFCYSRPVDSYTGKLEPRGRNNTEGNSKQFRIGSIPWLALHLAYQYIAWSVRTQDHHLQVAPMLSILPDVIEYYESVNPAACLFERMYFIVYFSLIISACPQLKSCTVWTKLSKKVENWLKVFNYEFSLLAIAAVDKSNHSIDSDRDSARIIQTEDEDNEMLEVVANLLDQTMSKAQCRNYSRHRSTNNALTPIKLATTPSTFESSPVKSTPPLSINGQTSIAERMFECSFTASMFHDVVQSLHIDQIFSSVVGGGDTEVDISLSFAKVWREICIFIVDFMDFAEDEVLPARMIEFGFLEDFTLNAGGANPELAMVPVNNTSAAVTLFPCSSTSKYLKDLIASVGESEGSRLVESWKQQDSVYTKYEIKWSRIFTQLANERGPWGYAADSKSNREVYWTLDLLETDKHLRMRLTRNPLGSRHRIASLKAAGIEDAHEQAVALSNFEEHQEESEMASLSTMYAALKKYKKRKLLEQQGGDKKSSSVDKLSDDEDESTEGGSVMSGENANNAFGGGLAMIGSGDAASILLDVEVITAASNSSGGKTKGRLEITRYKLTFHRQDENQEYDFVNTTGNSEFLWSCTCYPTTTWMTSEITGVYRRYYQMRFVALEIFFLNRTSIFFNCYEKHLTRRAYRFFILLAKAPNMKNLFLGRPQDGILKACVPVSGGNITSTGSAMNIMNNGGVVSNMTSNTVSTSNLSITDAWIQRKISNFDYLMYLNFIAGRNYHDLAQYPVFPWVLSDYTSSTLDLRDPKIYRKFHLPMAAQLESQQELLIDKYEASKLLQDDGIFPYHTGSHYSTSAMIIWYLMRMEPFTSYHVWLQEGNFDRPDRLFHSIENTYLGCTTNTQDVKELIPEFYYNSEFLYNINQCDFGIKHSTGQPVNDVILPPWCRDAHDFIRIHREALESEYVSNHLHQWIDLIFGYKQRPSFLSGGNDHCIESFNVFVHLSYLDAVDLESMKISDPLLYNRTIRQIDCYGQTPCQLFTKEHPKRRSLTDFRILIWPIASVLLGADTIPFPSDDDITAMNATGTGTTGTSTVLSDGSKEKHGKHKGKSSMTNNNHQHHQQYPIPTISLDKPSKIVCYGEYKVSYNPIVFVIELTSNERLVTIDSNRILGLHSFQHRKVDNVPPYAMKIDKIALQQSTSSSSSLASSSSTNSTISSGPSLVPGGLISYAISSTSSMMAQKEKEKIVGIPFAASIYLSSSTGVSNSNSTGTSISSGSTSSSGSRSSSRLTSSSRSRAGSMSSRQSSRVSHGTDAMFRTNINGGGGSVVGAGETIGDGTSIGGSSGAIGSKDRVDEHLSPHLFCALSGGVGKFLISCGHWDNTFKLTNAESGKLVQSLSYHRDVVTCIASTSDIGNKHWIIAGSKDCTLSIWEVFPDRGNDEPVNPSPCQTLYGHDDVVNCIAVNGELDMVVSGSDDGTILVHSLREGTYIRSITLGLFAGKDGIGGSSLTTAIGAVTMRPGMDANGTETAVNIESSKKITFSTPTPESDAATATVAKKEESHDVGLDIDKIEVTTPIKDSSAANNANSSTPTVSSPVPSTAPPTPLQQPNQPQSSSSMDKPRRVHSVSISKQGYILAYSHDGYILSSYTLNGRFLRSIMVRERFYSLCLSKDGRVLLTGGEKGLITMRWVHNLNKADNGARTGLQSVIDGSSADDDIPPFPSPIRSMCFTMNERHLVVGLETGEVRILAQVSNLSLHT